MDDIKNTMKMMQVKFRNALIKKRSSDEKGEHDLLLESLKAEDARCNELGISDSESEVRDYVPTEEDSDSENEEQGRRKYLRRKSSGKIEFLEVEISSKVFELAQHTNLRGLLFKATTDSIRNIINVFMEEFNKIIQKTPVAGQESRKLSLKRRRDKVKKDERGGGK